MPQSTDPNAPDYVSPGTFTSGPAPGMPGSKSNPYGKPGGPVDPAQAGITGYTPNGIPIYGSESDPSHLSTGNWRGGVTNDVSRYRDMAANGAAPTPQIAQPDQARDLNNDAIGMLGARAGGAETPEDILARQQTAGAVAGIQSGAASIKGGAAARAAAARGAIATGARVNAMGLQDQQALHARGMADAAGQYFGAATGQRGTEMGLAASQAQLEAQQRAQAEQRGEFYEGMGQDTKNAALGADLGQTAAATAAASADRRAGLAEASQGWENTKDLVGGASSGASGAVAAYKNATAGGTPSGGGNTGDPNDPNNPNYSGSDPRMKRDIHPVTDAQAARLKHSGEMMLGQQRAALGAGASVGHRAPAPEAYDGKYLDGRAYADKPDVISGAGPAMRRPGLLDAIERQIASDKASEPRYGYFDEDEGNSRPRFSAAPPGYAASRAGQPGAMFGAPPQAAPPPDPYAGQAPGTADFYAGAHHLMSKGDRDIAMSDPRAKQEAFELGHAAGVARALAPGATRSTTDRRHKAGEAPPAATTDGFIVTTSGPTEEMRLRHVAAGKSMDAARAGEADRLAAARQQIWDAKHVQQPGAPIAHTPEPTGDFDTQVQDRFGAPPPAPPPPAPPPQAGDVPGYFGLGPATRTMVSDPRTKTSAHDSPMADANRSMAPSSYEYKPEFTPPEQRPGEVNVGPMADKMEANPVAKTAIVKDPHTGLLAIDKTKGLKLVMGGLADLQRQVDRMKGARP